MNDEELLAKVKGFLKKGLADNQNWCSRARTAYRFYLGEQWDSADLEILKNEGRPAFTINRILPVINLLSGVQRQNRQDIKVYARRGGTEKVAAVLTELAKHTQDISNGEWEFSAAFLDGIICGKGWLSFDIDYNNDPLNGDLVIQKLSPFDVIEDREVMEYDLNRSAKYIIRRFWADKEELLLRYPDMKNEIDVAALREGADPAMPGNDIGDADPLHETNDYSDEQQGGDGVSERKYRFRVYECWWRSYERRKFLVNVSTLEFMRIGPKKEDVAKALARTANEKGVWTIKERIAPVLHVTTFTGDILLENRDDPYGGLTVYPFARFCPYHVNDNIMGVIDNLVDPQKEHNKRRSQVLHHLNQSANSGWMGDRDALTSEGWDELKEFGSKPGHQIKLNPGKTLERINPSPLSVGHMTIAEQSSADIDRISGVNPDLQGRESSAHESGRLALLRKNQGMLVNEILFDNFNFTRQIYAQTLVDFIRLPDITGNSRSKLYSDAEIAALISEKNLDVDMEQLTSFATGRYGVKVSQSPTAPTIQLANYELLIEALRAGLPINPKHILEVSNLPNKDEMVKDIEQREAAAAQVAEEQRRINVQKQEMEMQKQQMEMAKLQVELAGAAS